MTKEELEQTHEQIEYMLHRIRDFATDAGVRTYPRGIITGVCCLCPQNELAGPPEETCSPTGCGPRTVWVPKEHAAIIKIAYRREP